MPQASFNIPIFKIYSGINMVFCQKCGHKNQDGATFCAACGTKISNSGNASMLGATSASYAGFWIRVGAYCIDVVVLLIPILLISSLLKLSESSPSEAGVTKLLEFFFNVMVWWIYMAVLNSSAWQASVGKKVLGLKVVDKNMNRLTFGRASGRYFAEFVSALPLGIGYILGAWTKKKQCLHDLIVGTYVIKA